MVAGSGRQLPVQELPAETLVFLLGSRYCETDRLSQAAWDLFDKTPGGWARGEGATAWAGGRLFGRGEGGRIPDNGQSIRGSGAPTARMSQVRAFSPSPCSVSSMRAIRRQTRSERASSTARSQGGPLTALQTCRSGKPQRPSGAWDPYPDLALIEP